MSMKLICLAFILSCFFNSSTFAQSCTPAVPADTCKLSGLFDLSYLKNAPQVIIADPDSFKRKGDQLKSEYTLTVIELNLKLRGRSSAPYRYEYSEHILFIRDSGDSCPSTIFISTDAFRPLKSVLKDDGSLDFEKSYYEDGFEVVRVLPAARFVRGYIAGCREGAVEAACWNTK